MNKGLGLLIFGIVALVAGAVGAALYIKNRMNKEDDFEDDGFDTAVDDEEFDHFFGDDDAKEVAEGDEASDEDEEK